MEGKRTYTVPILLIIVTVLTILLVLAYSKLLLSQQRQAAEEGLRLAEQYEQAALLANRLQDGAEALLQGAAADRPQAAWLLGEADGAKKEALKLFKDASSRTDEPSSEDADKQLQDAMDALFAESGGVLSRLAEQAEPLSSEQKAMLQAVRDGAASMNESLGRFRLPTVDSGYRSMAAGVDWVEPALEAGRSLIEIAGQLK